MRLPQINILLICFMLISSTAFSATDLSNWSNMETIMNSERSFKSTLNTTTTALGSGATYTGTFEQNNAPDALVMCKTGNTGTLYFDFSPDGVNVDSTFPVNGFKIAADVAEVHIARKGPRYFRVRLVNDSGEQTYLRLETYYGSFGPLSAPVNQSLGNDSDAILVHSLDEETDLITGKYGTDRYTVTKFGRNTDIDTNTVPEDVWGGGGVYTGFPVGVVETVSISSDSASDASAGTGARTVRIFGLDGNFNTQQEDITLNGVSRVASALTWARVNRAYVLTAGTSTTNVGNLTISHTTTTVDVFTKILAGYGQTEIAAYTIPAGYTGYLRSYRASLNDTTSNGAVLLIWTREPSSAVRLQRPFSISTNHSADTRLYGAISFPEKTDISFRVISTTNSNADVSTSFDILLVKN